MHRRRSIDETADWIRERYGDRGYVAYHAPRYAYLLRVLEPHLGGEEPRTVLDVGTSVLTNILRDRFAHRIDTLDLVTEAERQRGYEPHAEGEARHYVFDLNHLEQGATGPADLGRYDAVIFCEVLEHLRISPRYVFRFLRAHLEPRGLLVLQTPNAAAISKRVKLALGRNPYGLIGEDPRNPGHYREYTLCELRVFAGEVGLREVSAEYASYFDARHAGHGGREHSMVDGRLQNAAYRLLPPTWRLGITAVFSSSSGDQEA